MTFDVSKNTIQSLNWGGDSSFPSYQGYMNSPAAPVTGGDSGGGSPAGGSGNPASGSGAAPSGSPAAGSNNGGSPASTGAQGGSPTSSPNGPAAVDWNTAPAQFREAFNKLKGDYEKYSGLGDFETVNTHAQFVQTIVNEAYTVGEKLGFTEQQIQTALEKDAVMTLHYLRSQAQKARGQNGQGNGQGQGQPNQPPDVKKLIEQELDPIRNHINAQQTDAANNRFDTEFQRLLGESYGEEVASLPPKFRKLLYDATSEIFKYDQQGISDLKFNQKVAAVARHFASAKAAVEEAYAEYASYQTKRAGRPRTGGNQGGNQGNQRDNGGGNGDGGVTLEDVIEGNAKALAKIPSMRQGR